MSDSFEGVRGSQKVSEWVRGVPEGVRECQRLSEQSDNVRECQRESEGVRGYQRVSDSVIGC